MTGILIKRGKADTETQGEGPVKMKGPPASHEQRPGTDPPLAVPRRDLPADPVIEDLQAEEP